MLRTEKKKFHPKWFYRFASKSHKYTSASVADGHTDVISYRKKTWYKTDIKTDIYITDIGFSYVWALEPRQSYTFLSNVQKTQIIFIKIVHNVLEHPISVCKGKGDPNYNFKCKDL